MYTGLLHTHRLVVILFLLLYVVKLVLLLLNREENLASLTKRTKIPEMVLSALFLLTGIGMLFQIAEISTMLIVKIVMVLASIPLAVIGFRRANKLLAILSVLLLVGVYGIAEANKVGYSTETLAGEVVTDAGAANYDVLAHGQALYERNCIVCHGPEGDMQGSGAKNLRVSELSEAEMRQRIMNGKNSMPGYAKIYSPQEIDAVLAYIATFRQ